MRPAHAAKRAPLEGVRQRQIRNLFGVGWEYGTIAMWPEIRLALEQIRREREQQIAGADASDASDSSGNDAERQVEYRQADLTRPRDNTSPKPPSDHLHARSFSATSSAQTEWDTWFELAPVGLATLDRELRIHRANPAFAQLIAAPLHSLENNSFKAYTCSGWEELLERHYLDVQETVAGAGNADADRANACCEMLVQTPNGPRLVMLVSRLLPPVDDGAASGQLALTVILDVSVDRLERRELRNRLRELESQVLHRSLELTRTANELEQSRQNCRELATRIDALQDICSDAMITMNGDGLIQLLNAAAEKMFGYPRDEAVNVSISRLLAHGEWDSAVELMKAEENEGRFHHVCELRAQNREGQTFPVDVSVRRVPDLEILVCVLRDISERRALQQQVLEVSENEKRAIGQELHDSIGQQLTGLRFYAEMLSQALDSKGLPEAEQANKLREILANVGDEVRQLSHGLMPSVVSADRLPDALAHLASNLDYISHISCKFNCDRALDLTMNASTATQLFRIAQEAAQNAVRHSQGDMITIELKSEAEDLCVRVTDNGVGVAEDALRKDNSGIRIMEYRAALIGAWLNIEPAAPSGTSVECKLKTNRQD